MQRLGVEQMVATSIEDIVAFGYMQLHCVMLTCLKAKGRWRQKKKGTAHLYCEPT